MDSQVWNVLLIEHSPEDVQVFEHALAEEPPLPGRLHVVEGIQQALDFIRDATLSPPSLVLFNTRGSLADDGLVGGLRNLRRLTGVPIILFCAPEGRREIGDAYRSFAAACAIIPEERDRFASLVRQTLAYWLTQVLLPHPADSRPAQVDERESPRA